ncbi:unnamed protein product [Arctogadus glacialis]
MERLLAVSKAAACSLHRLVHTHFAASAVTPIVSGDYSHHRDKSGMASRVSFSQYRLEAEIERHRAECQWDKIPALIDQLLTARIHEDGTLWLIAMSLLVVKARISGPQIGRVNMG